jgi:ABC-type transport system involved in multi-copper enzyme maturation permease subunit
MVGTSRENDMISNPIVQREFVSLLRTRKAVLLQIGLVFVLALLVLIRWPSSGVEELSGKQSRQVLQLFGYGMMVALTLLAPVFPAASIVRERLQGTLALLFNTPMSRASILIGKLAGVLGFSAMLLVLSIPAAAACFAMGGVALGGDLLKLYAILALIAVQYGTLGLLVSSYSNSMDGALRVCYGIIMFLSIIALGPYQFLQGLPWVGQFGQHVVDWVRCVSPIAAMMHVLGQGDAGGGGMVSSTDVAARYMLIAAVSSAVFIVWTYVRLNQRIFDRGRVTGKITDDRSVAVQGFRRLFYLWFFDPQRRSQMIGPMTNPVMMKEFRTRRFGRSYWLVRMAGACLVVSLGLMLLVTNSTMDWDVPTLIGIMAVLQMSLVVLLTPSLASGLISNERESRGWQLLQMTPLSAMSIIVGKLLSVTVTLSLLLCATLPAYLILARIPQEPPLWAMSMVLISLLFTTIFAISFSAMLSSLFARTATATAVAYTCLIAICGGTLLFWLGLNDPFGPSTVEAALTLNPLASALSVLDISGFSQFDLVPANWWVMGGGSVVCLLVLLVQTWRLTRPR